MTEYQHMWVDTDAEDEHECVLVGLYDGPIEGPSAEVVIALRQDQALRLRDFLNDWVPE